MKNEEDIRFCQVYLGGWHLEFLQNYARLLQQIDDLKELYKCLDYIRERLLFSL